MNRSQVKPQATKRATNGLPGRFSESVTRNWIEQEIYRSQAIPGPIDYGDAFYNHVGRNGSYKPHGGSFNQSFPKTDVEWQIYNSQRTFPNGYPYYELSDPNAIANRTGAAELSTKTWATQSPRLWNRWYRTQDESRSPVRVGPFPTSESRGPTGRFNYRWNKERQGWVKEWSSREGGPSNRKVITMLSTTSSPKLPKVRSKSTEPTLPRKPSDATTEPEEPTSLLPDGGRATLNRDQIAPWPSGRASVPLSLEASTGSFSRSTQFDPRYGTTASFPGNVSFQLPSQAGDTLTVGLHERLADPALSYQTESMPMFGRTLSDKQLHEAATASVQPDHGGSSLTVHNVQAFLDASPVRKAKEVRTKFDLRSWVVHLKNLRTMAEKGTLAFDAQKPLDSGGARTEWIPQLDDARAAMHGSRLSMIPHQTGGKLGRSADSLSLTGESAMGRTAIVRAGSGAGFTGAADAPNKQARASVEQKEAVEDVVTLETPGRAKQSQRIAPLVQAVKTGFSSKSMLKVFAAWDPKQSGSIPVEHAPACLMACVRGDTSLHPKLILEEMEKEGMLAGGQFQYQDFVAFIKDQVTAAH